MKTFRIYTTILFICLVFLLSGYVSVNAKDMDKVIDIFFKRYKDYPQLYQDMSFIIGNWDFLEAKLREEIANVLNNQYKVYPGETAVGQSIVNVCNRRTLPYNMQYTFHVIDLPGINAFAIPGGGIYITKEFINEIYKSPNPEARLAFVFGHEIAHITQRHWISSLKQRYTMDFWQWAATELSRKNNTEFLNQIIPPIMEAIYAGYSRDHEREADSLGIQYMERAGFDIQGAVDALEMLASLGTSGYTIWSSHPRIIERVEFARKMKSNYEKSIDKQLQSVLDQCSSDSGVFTINIQQPTGFFPGIGNENVFEEFAVLFFNSSEVKATYESGKDINVPMFSSSHPGKYYKILPIGDYVLFYKAKAMKRWFTPYQIGSMGWGPPRVSVRSKGITNISISPNGSSCQVYDYIMNVPSPHATIDHEFFQRFVLDKQTENRFAIDFSPLPDQAPIKENIEVSGSSGIEEKRGHLVMPSGGLEILAKFSVFDGTPSSARLTVTCSTDPQSAVSSTNFDIEVNGKKRVVNHAVTTKTPLAYSWDITDNVIAGMNAISIIRSNYGSALAIYAIEINVYGAGLGSFYTLE